MTKEILNIRVVRDLPEDCSIPSPSKQAEDKNELIQLLSKIIFPMAETVTVTYEIENA